MTLIIDSVICRYRVKAAAIHAIFGIYGVITMIFTIIFRRIVVFASASFSFCFFRLFAFRIQIEFRVDRIEVLAVQMFLNDSKAFAESLIVNNFTFS